MVMAAFVDLHIPAGQLTSPVHYVGQEHVAAPLLRPAAAVAERSSVRQSFGSPVSLGNVAACFAAYAASKRAAGGRRALRGGRRRASAVRRRAAEDELGDALSDDGDEAAVATRRRRRKRKPGATVSQDLELVKKPSVNCDCEHILDTLLELEDVLTPFECEHLIATANRTAEERPGCWNDLGNWRKMGQEYTTQDVRLGEMQSMKVQRIMRDSIIAPLTEVIAEHFRLPKETISIADSYIVRYTTEAEDGQVDLQAHRDGALVSAYITLSDSADYEGGGTFFDDDNSVYKLEQGDGIVFAGQRLHGAQKITSGNRYILSVFFKVGNVSCREEAVMRDVGDGGGKFLKNWNL
eukprot:TRINITY_DN21069_c0_g1_i1.p1 TRINITY_DN21069_c0_g1~~TRINITY_DN21069_c0_g1_i1.p1  ORF type:complete len:352 (+),score=64.28 TRINITY_DN21069_c0_g1_i1:126-1181(+)